MGDLRVFKGIWQVRFPAAALLLDSRGKIANAWQYKGDLSEWRISQNDVLVHNLSHTTYLYANSKEISVSIESPNSYNDFKQIAADFSIKTLQMLEVAKISRIGLRLTMLAERPHFRTLVRKMRTRLYNITEDDWNILGGYPEDIGMSSMIFKLDDDRVNLSIGPIERTQLAEQFRSGEVRSQLPETSLLVDFDLFHNEPKWNSNSYPKLISNFLTEGGEKIQKLGNEFIDRLGGFE